MSRKINLYKGVYRNPIRGMVYINIRLVKFLGKSNPVFTRLVDLFTDAIKEEDESNFTKAHELLVEAVDEANKSEKDFHKLKDIECEYGEKALAEKIRSTVSQGGRRAKPSDIKNLREAIADADKEEWVNAIFNIAMKRSIAKKFRSTSSACKVTISPKSSLHVR